MNRREFIDGLKKALELKMSKSEIDKQLEYYNSYIKSEVNSGRSEKDVVSELGDPWAVAKNLSYDIPGETIEAEDIQREDNTHKTGYGNSKVYTTHSKWAVYGVIFTIIVLLFAVLSLFFGILKILSPVLLPIMVIVFIIRIVRNNS